MTKAQRKNDNLVPLPDVIQTQAWTLNPNTIKEQKELSEPSDSK